MQVVVDTNVFLDFLLDRENADDAEAFFLWCRKYKVKPLITSMSLRDIEYIAHQRFHDRKLSRDIQIKAYQMSNKVLGISADSAIESLYNDGDYEDTLIINAAKENLMDAIVTNNTKDFRDKTMPCFTPQEIIKIEL